MAIYKDIKIENDDLLLDGNQAVIIYDRDVITQDIIHAIRESGLLVDMIAERHQERRELLFTQIILLVEEDSRIIPGTVNLSASPDNFSQNKGNWTLTADTYEFNEIAIRVI